MNDELEDVILNVSGVGLHEIFRKDLALAIKAYEKRVIEKLYGLTDRHKDYANSKGQWITKGDVLKALGIDKSLEGE